MTHLHIPDGVLPWWLVLAGWAVTLPLVWLAGRMVGRDPAMRRKVPLLGVVAALVLVAMSTEVVPIAYHINLTVVAGILLGPWLAIIAAFIVDVILALIGHGGVTVIGLNTVMIASEMVIGWALFRLVTRLIGRGRAPGAVAALSTVLTLAVTTTMLVGIVAIGGPAATRRESGAFDPATLSFSNPFAGGVVQSHLADVTPESAAASRALTTRRFATVVFILGPLGWALEAAIGAAVVGFVARVRPALIYGGPLAAEPHILVGDQEVSH